MFDQFGAIGRGHNQVRRQNGIVGNGNGAFQLRVTAIRERFIELAKNGGAAIVIAAHNDAVGIKKIGDAEPSRRNSGLEPTSNDPKGAP